MNCLKIQTMYFVTNGKNEVTASMTFTNLLYLPSRCPSFITVFIFLLKKRTNFNREQSYYMKFSSEGIFSCIYIYIFFQFPYVFGKLNCWKYNLHYKICKDDINITLEWKIRFSHIHELSYRYIHLMTRSLSHRKENYSFVIIFIWKFDNSTR